MTTPVPAGTFPPQEHIYLSTACLHGRHDHCQAMTGTDGTKRPGMCKFCDACCICDCHVQAVTG